MLLKVVLFAYSRGMIRSRDIAQACRDNTRLNRFTLRGQKKVDTQWKLYCLVHDIEKLAHYGNLQ